jgi:hypothetical protein
VTHARDIWWTLDFPNAFVSPGVNSRGELVPSHGASRRRLGDKRCRNELNKIIKATKVQFYNTKLQNSENSKEGWDTLNNLLNRKSKKPQLLMNLA